MPPIDVEPLLTEMGAFVETLYVVRDAIVLPPSKEHICACINYSDLLEMRRDFVRELANTIVPFVYHPGKQRELRDRMRIGRSEAGAWSELLAASKAKFRSSNVRGQFAELILCNVLQYYFRAAPLLRKMSLTTNPRTERNGADAIHVGVRDERYVIYLGEAKTSLRKTGAFKDALGAAITDAVEVHYPKHRDELDCYVYEDFLSPELQALADDYKAGRLANDVEVEIVCLAAFDPMDTITGATRQERLQNALSCVYRLAAPKNFTRVLSRIPSDLLPRMNYVVFPARSLQKLIEEFQSYLLRD